jgi:hypothetical protein
MKAPIRVQTAAQREASDRSFLGSPAADIAD